MTETQTPENFSANGSNNFLDVLTGARLHACIGYGYVVHDLDLFETHKLITPEERITLTDDEIIKKYKAVEELITGKGCQMYVDNYRNIFITIDPQVFPMFDYLPISPAKLSAEQKQKLYSLATGKTCKTPNVPLMYFPLDDVNDLDDDDGSEASAGSHAA